MENFFQIFKKTSMFGAISSYIIDKKQDSFGDNSIPIDINNSDVINNVGSILNNFVIYSLITTAIMIWAFYLAFKHRAPGGGVDLIQILAACCCAPCYIAYSLANP